MSDSLWPHGLQHNRLPCPSPTPRACSNPCLLHWQADSSSLSDLGSIIENYLPLNNNSARVGKWSLTHTFLSPAPRRVGRGGFPSEPAVQFSSVQSLSRVQLFATPWTAAQQASLSITNSWSLLKFKSIEFMIPFNHLIPCRPLLLLPSIFPSIRVFSNESALRIRWPKYWSFSFSISPSNEYSGLISFRMDWLDLLAVQGTLKSLLQHHSSKVSIQIK